MAMTNTLDARLGQDPIDNAEEQSLDYRLWSVTTIIDVLDKPALIYWGAGETSHAAIKARHSLVQRVEEEGEEAVWKWLRDARFRQPKDKLSAAKLGTCAHAACEQYALTGVRPDNDDLARFILAENEKMTKVGIASESVVLNQMLDRFDEWLARFQPSYQAAEVTVYHPTYGYAGTCDGFLTIDGTRFIIDYKTSREPRDGQGRPKTPYPEAALQISAYRFAEAAAVWRPRRMEKFRRRYYLLSEAEREVAVPVPEVDAGLVIHLTTEHCESFVTRCDEEVFRSFLFILEASRWVNGLAKDVIGDPLVEPRKEA